MENEELLAHSLYLQYRFFVIYIQSTYFQQISGWSKVSTQKSELVELFLFVNYLTICRLSALE